jgi:hypothetical protein
VDTPVLISNFMKIRPLEDELFYTDGQTDRHGEPNSPFSQFCERAYKNSQLFGYDLRHFKAKLYAHDYLQDKYFAIKFI